MESKEKEEAQEIRKRMEVLKQNDPVEYAKIYYLLKGIMIGQRSLKK